MALCMHLYNLNNRLDFASCSPDIDQVPDDGYCSRTTRRDYHCLLDSSLYPLRRRCLPTFDNHHYFWHLFSYIPFTRVYLL